MFSNQATISILLINGIIKTDKPVVVIMTSLNAILYYMFISEAQSI